MRPLKLAFASLPFLASLPFVSVAHAEPTYFIRDIGSIADCHKEYSSLAGDWRHHYWFKLHRLAGGREHVLNCMPDGVQELVCNPAGGKLAVAIVAGETEAGCHSLTPELPTRPAMLPH